MRAKTRFAELTGQEALTSQEIAVSKRAGRCLIRPDRKWKVVWDLWLSLLVVASALYTPWRLAFLESVGPGWLGLELVLDAFFLGDVVMNFFSATFDELELLVWDPRKVACGYVRSWFALDLLAALPLTLAAERLAGAAEFTTVARLGKVFRLLRLISLLRVARLMRKGRVGQTKRGGPVPVKRLCVFLATFFVLCHVSACLWFFLARLEDFPPDCWVVSGGYDGAAPSQLYLIGFYFTVTTVTTVGYGDMSAGTDGERVFCVLLMVGGVLAYSFAISAFASLFATLDARALRLNKQLTSLALLRAEFDLDPVLCARLKRSFLYEHSRASPADSQALLEDLPPALRVALSDAMFRKTVEGLPFFESASPHFLAQAGPALRPVRLDPGDTLFAQGDPVDAVYFLKKGRVRLVLPGQKGVPDLIYASFREGALLGEADFFAQPGEGGLSRRCFMAKAQGPVELLVLTKSSLLTLAEDFRPDVNRLFSGSQVRL